MNIKHAPELWSISHRPDGSLEIQEASGQPICVMSWNHSGLHEANATRIVATVNACAGMEDPTAEIAAMRWALERILRCPEAEIVHHVARAALVKAEGRSEFTVNKQAAKL